MGILQARLLEWAAIAFSSRIPHVPSSQTVCWRQSPWTAECYSSQVPNPTQFCSLPPSAVSPLPCCLALSPTLSQGLSQPLISGVRGSQSLTVSDEASHFTACPHPLNKGSVLLKEPGGNQLVLSRSLSPDSASLPWLLHSPLT